MNKCQEKMCYVTFFFVESLKLIDCRGLGCWLGMIGPDMAAGAKMKLANIFRNKKHLTSALMMKLGTDSNGHRRKWWCGKMLQRAVSSDLLNCLLHECSHRCHSSNVNLSASNISFSQEIDVVLNLISLAHVNRLNVMNWTQSYTQITSLFGKVEKVKVILVVFMTL